MLHEWKYLTFRFRLLSTVFTVEIARDVMLEQANNGSEILTYTFSILPAYRSELFILAFLSSLDEPFLISHASLSSSQPASGH